MDNENLIETVESMLGKNMKIIDCETSTAVHQEEFFLINGIPVQLDGSENEALKSVLLTGEMPPCNVLNSILIRAGILQNTVSMETTMSVKSTVISKEEIQIAQEGEILSSKTSQTTQDNFYTSLCSEIWHKVPTQYETSERVTSNSSSLSPSLISIPFHHKESPEPSISNSCSLGSTSSNFSNSLPASNSTSIMLPNKTLSTDSGNDDATVTNCSLSSLYDNACLQNSNEIESNPNQLRAVPPQEIVTKILGSSSSSAVESNSREIRKSDKQLQQDSKDVHVLIYRDDHLISGTLPALIQHMVPNGSYSPESSYLFAFLLSSRLFIRPHELFEQVCLICDKQQDLRVLQVSRGSEQTESLKTFSHQMLDVLREWMEIFPYDFRSDRVMHHVRYITQKCIQIDETLSKTCSKLFQNLLTRLKVLENYEEFLQQIHSNRDENRHQSPPTNQVGGSSNTSSSTSANHLHYINHMSTDHLQTGGSTSSDTESDLIELCSSPLHLAQQLTHIELERLYHIGPEEFVQAFAKENVPQMVTARGDIKKTKNLECYVQWFNRLSYLVATEIVRHPKKKQRIRLIEFWIETARECFNIGNFNSLMAIIAGLNMAPILRLKKTWSKIQSAKFSILEHQMDPSNNFNSYRSTLKAAMWRATGATDERQRIIIPFFSLLVKDLYFLNEGCSNKLPNDHINFEKFWQLAKQVQEFIQWKQVTCPFERSTRLVKFLQSCSIMNENSLAMSSFECETPENTMEKDRYKILKNEHG